MTRFYFTRTLPLIVIGTTLLLASLSPLAMAREGSPTPSLSHARSVALSDATRAPDYMTTVKAHSKRTISPRIARTLTETSAYRWDGSALPGQTGQHVARWGGVTYDGRTIVNRTDAPIIFAGWES